MKKKYIRPESRLFLINLAENIAASGDSGGSGDGTNGDFMQNGIIIHFSQFSDGCRGVYTNDATAVVRASMNDPFYAYLDDLYEYFYCSKPDHFHTVRQNGCRGYV